MRLAMLVGGAVLLSVGAAMGQSHGGAAGLGLPWLGSGARVGFGQGSLLEASQGAVPVHRLARPARRWRRGGRRSRIYPLPYYYGAYAYGASQPEQLRVSVENVPPSQPAVLINRDYKPEKPKPVVRNYGEGELPEPVAGLRSAPAPTQRPPGSGAGQESPGPGKDKPVIYLIALKNQTIYPAVRYWVEGDTLHYIDTRGARKQIALSMIDRDFSIRLNRERNIPVVFELP